MRKGGVCVIAAQCKSSSEVQSPLPGATRQQRSAIILTSGFLLLIVTWFIWLWKYKVGSMTAIIVSIAFIMAAGWLLARIINRVEEAHEKWLQKNGLAITATVTAVIGRHHPGELSDFTVIAIGEDPMTHDLREYKFFDNHPGAFSERQSG
jgi:hypothetical protein